MGNSNSSLSNREGHTILIFLNMLEKTSLSLQRLETDLRVTSVNVGAKSVSSRRRRRSCDGGDGGDSCVEQGWG